MTDDRPTGKRIVEETLQRAMRLHDEGQADAAEALYRQVLERAPEQAEALRLLAALRRECGDTAEAAELCRRAVNAAPGSVAAWLELTRTAHDCGDWRACATAAGETLTRDPENAEAALMQATALFARHDYKAATRAIELVAPRLPEDGGVHLFHARCLMAQNRFMDALAPALRAATLLPDDPDAQYVLGAAQKRTGQNEAAEATLHRTLTVAPKHHEAWNDLADIYIARGDTQAALTCLRRSHAAAPYNLDAISGLCFYTAFDRFSDAAALFDINRDWSRRLNAEADSDALPAPSVVRPDSRIRIAYMAYDLFDHVTSWFLEPVLARHDRSRFHITGYYGNEKTDQVTERLGGYVDSWQNIAGEPIADTAARIRRDGIDILILASFFRGKDRRILAYRAAPLQVGYHNRVASTGLNTVDYIVTEAVSDPVGRVEPYYTEALVRLTNHNVYLPPPEAPAPRPPPCLENGIITFGSFNNIAKISDDVIETWARILNAIQKSRLILRSSIHFENATTQDFFRRRFAAHGVAAERLEFQGLRPERRDHLAGISEADIALDPFPCNGGTTSCEVLWMGLPLVTLESDSYMGRQGASYLDKLGLRDLIATTTEDYVEIATRLAADTGRLQRLRQTLRPAVEREMFNYTQHVNELETTYVYILERLRSEIPPASFTVNDRNIVLEN